MGQSLKKFASDENKNKEIEPIVEECYEKYFTNPEMKSSDFYHAICLTVEEINKKFGSTSFRVPKTSTIEHSFKKHYEGKGKSLTREEFQKILQEIIWDTGVTGIGAKDIFFFMFGVPSTALLIKQKLIPTAIPNEFFIPVITSATVSLLAFLNKI